MRELIANLLIKLAIRIDPSSQSKPKGAFEAQVETLPQGLHFGSIYIANELSMFCVAKGMSNGLLLGRYQNQIEQERLNEDRLLLDEIFERD